MPAGFYASILLTEKLHKEFQTAVTTGAYEDHVLRVAAFAFKGNSRLMQKNLW